MIIMSSLKVFFDSPSYEFYLLDHIPLAIFFLDNDPEEFLCWCSSFDKNPTLFFFVRNFFHASNFTHKSKYFPLEKFSFLIYQLFLTTRFPFLFYVYVATAMTCKQDKVCWRTLKLARSLLEKFLSKNFHAKTQLWLRCDEKVRHLTSKCLWFVNETVGNKRGWNEFMHTVKIPSIFSTRSIKQEKAWIKA